MIGMLYGKSIYIVAIIAAAILVFKICRDLKLDTKSAKWGSFIFASSILVYTNVCIIGQSDIIGIVFILLGLNSYIKKNDRKFVFWFMIATSFKVYALFIFVPLFVLKEKRIPVIALKSIIVVSLTSITNYIFDDGSAAIVEKTNFSVGMMERLLNNKVPFLKQDVSLFVILLGAVCIS